MVLVDRTQGGGRDTRSQAATGIRGTTNACLPQELR